MERSKGEPPVDSTVDSRQSRLLSWRVSILTWLAGSAAAWILIASPFIAGEDNGGQAEYAAEDEFPCADDDIECFGNLAPAAGPGVAADQASPVEICMAGMPAAGAEISEDQRAALQEALEDCLARAYSGPAVDQP